MTSQSNHFDSHGNARMVDVSEKPVTVRVATAQVRIQMLESTLAKIRAGEMKKGDVLAVARLAGIQATKHTSLLIPLCHPIPVEGVDVEFQFVDPSSIQCTCTVKTTARTGVEMEALTACSAAALTIYDMCKSIDREMSIKDLVLVEKSGGQSGKFQRDR